MEIYAKRVYMSFWVICLAVLSLFLLSFLNYSSLQAQAVAPVTTDNNQLRTLQPEDYGKWEQPGSGVLSPYGKWLAYTIRRVNGENELRIRNVETHEITVIPYGSNPVFSDNGTWLAYSIGVSEEEREKREEQGRPVRNKLGYLRLATGDQTEIEEVASFSFDEEGIFLVMKRYPIREKESNGVDIVVRNLVKGSDVNFGNVAEYAWRPGGVLLAMLIDAEGKAGNGIKIFNPETGILRVLDSESARYSGMVWREDEDDLAVFKGFSEEEYEGEGNVIMVWRNPGRNPRKIIYDPRTDSGFPAEMRIVNFSRVQWSDDGGHVFFGIQQWQKKETESESSDPAPALQIWHSKDLHIIPEQQQRAERNRQESHLAVWHIDENQFVQVTDEQFERNRVQTNADVVLGFDEAPYEFDIMFGRVNYDIFAIDIRTGARQKIISRIKNLYSISPDGTQLAYLKDDDYCVYDFKSGDHRNLTGDIPTSFVNTENDHPVEQMPPYGFVGWIKDSKSFLVNSKYDIWQLGVGGTGSRKITVGAGDKVIHRRVRWDRGEDTIDMNKTMYLSRQGEWSKKYGYARAVPGEDLESLIWQEDNVSGLMKAKYEDTFVYMVQDFDDSPDYFVCRDDFTDSEQISNTNPFQKDYAWGKSELIEYTNHNGRKLQGALFYPADYQPGKKYPMITYVYEMLSQSVRRYVVPSERSYYNINVFTHQGYFVLQPDIVFDPGDPGISSVRTMEAAIGKVVDMGLVDENRVGLLGHSWGGYQAGYAPTQTDIFAASVAGAGLTDFFSMYGMVFWSAGGLPETNHFEVGQERMIVPPWKDIEGYVRNSSVLQVENLNTPLLFMVGDNDRNVDWRQGIELYNTARRAGKHMVMLVYGNEGHSLRRDENRIDYQRRILQWFSHYLKGEPAQEWIEQGIPYREQLRQLKKWKKKS